VDHILPQKRAQAQGVQGAVEAFKTRGRPASKAAFQDELDEAGQERQALRVHRHGVNACLPHSGSTQRGRPAASPPAARLTSKSSWSGQLELKLAESLSRAW
jgi:hypothetical protein